MKKEKSEKYWIIFLTNSTTTKKTMGNIMIEGEPEEGGKNNDSKENRLKRKR